MKIKNSIFLYLLCLIFFTESSAQTSIEYCDTLYYHSYKDEAGQHCLFKRQIQQDGFYKAFKDKNAIEEFNVKNHQVHGPYRYFKNGGRIMMEGNYVEGFKSGIWKSFNPSNSNLVSSILTYKDGKLQGKAIYYDSEKGEVQFKGAYLNNKKNGKWKIYENGRCAGKIKFKYGAVATSYEKKDLWNAYKWRFQLTQ